MKEQDHLRQSEAREALNKAVACLCGPEPIRVRLQKALTELEELTPEDFETEEQRVLFLKITARGGLRNN